MRILQLCKKFPYPLKDGEAIAVTFLSKALRDLGCEITLLSMNTTKHYTDLEELPASFDHYKAIYSTPLDNAVNPVDAFLNLFSRSSYHVDRFISEVFRNKLIEVLKSDTFDIIQLETLYLTPYIETIKQYSNAQIVMRAHNVEHEIWDRISQNTSFLPKKWYLTHLTKKLRDYEVAHLNDYDYLVALTDRDLKRFKRLGYRNGATASPIGIDTDRYQGEQISRPANKGLSVCFIGSLDWMPNVEGLDWFLGNVWPIVQNKLPGVTLHVAGRNTPKSLLSKHIRGVKFHGEVPDAAAFIRQSDVMVVPLFSGSGMRVKILEGMALGKPIITTSLGMEGIEAADGKEIFIADSAEAFVEKMDDCRRRPDLAAAVGDAAKDFVQREFHNHALARQLYDVYSEMLAAYRDPASIES